MSKEEVIPYDSPKAAWPFQMAGWLSAKGSFFPGNHGQGGARYDGCTHRPCEDCGALCEKMWSVCDDCRKKRRRARFDAMPKREWKGEPLVELDGDEYVFDEDALEIMRDDRPDDPLFIFAEPIYLSELDTDHFADDLPDDTEPPEWLYEAIEAFNAALRANREPVSYCQPWPDKCVAAILPKREEPTDEE